MTVCRGEGEDLAKQGEHPSGGAHTREYIAAAPHNSLSIGVNRTARNILFGISTVTQDTSDVKH